MLSAKILILDFDGVLVDSAVECWQRCIEASNLDNTLKKFDLDDSKKELFLRYRYLVGPAKEFYYLIKAILLINDFKEVEKLFLKFLDSDKSKAKEFEKNFFKSRQKAKRNSKKDWIKSNNFFEPAIKLAKIFASDERLFIATLKDKASVKDLLNFNHIFISDSNILDLTYGSNKKEHIQNVLNRYPHISKKQFIFIDDNLRHLIEIKSLGITSMLATWGYNNKKSMLSAKLNKIKNLRLEECNKIIVR